MINKCVQSIAIAMEIQAKYYEFSCPKQFWAALARKVPRILNAGLFWSEAAGQQSINWRSCALAWLPRRVPFLLSVGQKVKNAWSTWKVSAAPMSTMYIAFNGCFEWPRFTTRANVRRSHLYPQRWRPQNSIEYEHVTSANRIYIINVCLIIQ